MDPEADVVVKIADLGIAKLKDNHNKADQLMTQMRGTPQYSTYHIIVVLYYYIRYVSYFYSFTYIAYC